MRSTDPRPTSFRPAAPRSARALALWRSTLLLGALCSLTLAPASARADGATPPPKKGPSAAERYADYMWKKIKSREEDVWPEEEAPTPPPTPPAPAGEGEDLGGWGDIDVEAETTDVEEGEHPVVRFWNWASESLQGHILYKNLTHFERDDDAGEHRLTRHEAEIRLEYRRTIWGPLGVGAQVDFRVDDDNYRDGVVQRLDNTAWRRPIVSFNDLYFLLPIGDLDIRAGYQTVGWGTGDFFNPTDNINPHDYADLYDNEKMGVLALKLNYYLAGFTIEGLYIPFFTPDRLPLFGKRFGSPVPVPPPGISVGIQRSIPDQTEGAQLAARVSRSFGGVDVSLSYYRGHNKLPALDVRATELPSGAVDLNTRLWFERVHVYGADFATTLGILPFEGAFGDLLRKVQVHGEAVFWDTRPDTFADYFRFVLGANYTFSNIIYDHDLTVLVDYMDEVTYRPARRTGLESFLDGISTPTTRAAAAAFQPQLGALVSDARALQRGLRGSLATRLTYKVSETFRFELTNITVLHSRTSTYFRPELVVDLTDNVRLSVAYDYFEGPRDSFFGRHRENDRTVFLAQVSF